VSSALSFSPMSEPQECALSRGRFVADTTTAWEEDVFEATGANCSVRVTSQLLVLQVSSLFCAKDKIAKYLLEVAKWFKTS
jgi:hypothetical protein